MISNDQQRLDTFNYLRDTTCDVLSDRGVQERLGARAGEIITALETGFTVYRSSSGIEIPSEEKHSNHIGFHPILKSDFILPNFSVYLSNPAPTNGVDVEPGKSPWNPKTWSAPIPTFAFGALAGLVNPKKSLLKESQTPRDLVIINQKVTSFTKPAIASIIAHEVDHALTQRELIATNPLQYTQNNRLHRTILERRAYPISAVILEETGQVPSDINVGALKEHITDISPKRAGKVLRNFVVKTANEVSEKTENRKRHNILAPYGAMALTEVFSGGVAQTPTSDEVEAYRSFGYVQ